MTKLKHYWHFSWHNHTVTSVKRWIQIKNEGTPRMHTPKCSFYLQNASQGNAKWKSPNCYSLSACSSKHYESESVIKCYTKNLGGPRGEKSTLSLKSVTLSERLSSDPLKMACRVYLITVRPHAHFHEDTVLLQCYTDALLARRKPPLSWLFVVIMDSGEKGKSPKNK